MRFGECVDKLKWDKVNLDTRVLVAFGKGRKERPVPLLDDFVAVLQQWKSHSTSDSCCPGGDNLATFTTIGRKSQRQPA